MSYTVTITFSPEDPSLAPTNLYQQTVETLDLATVIHVVNHPSAPPRKTRSDKGKHKELL